MRTLLFFIGLLCTCSLLSTSVFAAPQTAGTGKVIVTAKVPGASCTCVKAYGQKGEFEDDPTGCKDVKTAKYVCSTFGDGENSGSTGVDGLQIMIGTLIKYLIMIALLLGVLAIVALGIAWALFSGGDEEKMKKLKGYIINLMVGMLILFLFRYILVFLNPAVFS